jgi:hypothetical protein
MLFLRGALDWWHPQMRPYWLRIPFVLYPKSDCPTTDPRTREGPRGRRTTCWGHCRWPHERSSGAAPVSLIPWIAQCGTGGIPANATIDYLVIACHSCQVIPCREAPPQKQTNYRSCFCQAGTSQDYLHPVSRGGKPTQYCGIGDWPVSRNR